MSNEQLKQEAERLKQEYINAQADLIKLGKRTRAATLAYGLTLTQWVVGDRVQRADDDEVEITRFAVCKYTPYDTKLRIFGKRLKKNGELYINEQELYWGLRKAPSND